jgi:hypothetical protein
MGRICIFGAIGDCGAKIEKVSKTFNDTIQRNVSKTLISMSDQFGATTVVNQTINFGNCSEVIATSISQNINANVDVKKLSENITQDKLKSILKNEIKKASTLNSDIKKGFMSGATSTSDINEVYNTTINEVVNSYSYNNFKSSVIRAEAQQKILFGNNPVPPDQKIKCVVGDVSQNIAISVIAEDISKVLTQKFQDILITNQAKLDEQTTSKQESTGPIGEIGNIADNVTSNLMLPIVIFLAIIALIIGALLIWAFV